MGAEGYAILAVLIGVAVFGAIVFRQGITVAEADRATDQAKEAVDHARDVEKFAEDLGDVEARCAALEATIRALPHGPDRARCVRELLALRSRAFGRPGPPAAPGGPAPGERRSDPLA